MKKILKICGLVFAGLFFFAIFLTIFRRCGGVETPPDDSFNGDEGNFSDEDIFQEGEFDGLALDNMQTLNESLATSLGVVKYELNGDYEVETFDSGITLLGNERTEKISLKGGTRGATIIATGVGISAIQPSPNTTLEMSNITFIDETTEKGNCYTWALEFGGTIIFEDCEFADPIFLKDDANVTFKNCTFNSSVKTRYSVWVGDGSASFEGCTFKGTRGLKIHESGSDVVTVSVNNCLFDNLSDKPGLAIGEINVDPLETTISVTNSTFINCYSWDPIGSLEGVDGFYEIDTPAETFQFLLTDNEVTYTPIVFSITYKAVLYGFRGDKTLTEVPEKFYKKNGNYPTEYKGVLGATVDDLYRRWDIDRNNSQAFDGWFLDEACTVPFDGVIAPRSSGDITIYAKLQAELWTDFY